MKKINALLTLAALASPLFYMGCSSDVYDPDKTIVEPTPNPIGQGFSAPDGFKWSMINTVKLNVAVKDEFSGAYKYLVEVFTSSPLNNTSITPIAAGLTNSSYSTDVAISTDIKKLYIRQTDPKGRKEIYEYAVPEGGGTLTANLFYTATTTKAFSTRATGSTDYAYNNAGIKEPTDPNYKEDDVFKNIPTSSDTPSNDWGNGMVFKDGAKYIIGNEYTDNTPFSKDTQIENNGRMSIYVKGVWKISKIYYNYDIYVLDGGKIIGDGDITLGSQTNLYVQTGGKVVVNGTFTLKSKQTKNFGSIEVQVLNIDESIELFNANAITATGDKSQINGSSAIVVNHSKMIFNGSTSFIDASILNTSGAEIKANNLYLSSGKVFNHGVFTVANELSCNGGISTKLINRHDANTTINKILASLAVYNDGFMTVTDYLSNESNDVLYNSCTIIIKNSFIFKEIHMSKGSISAGKANDSDTWLPIPTITAKNSAEINLQNGSMIKATLFTGGNPTTFKGDGNDPSIIAVKEFNFEGHDTFISGNLVWSVDKETNAGAKKIDSTIPNTGYDESKYTIETCGGFYNQGDPGVAPYIPTIPTINDATTYTYAFEDNWPVYGDFDMNDLVVTLKNKSVSSDGKTVTFDLSLEAVGASKQLGLGIRIMNLSATPTVTVNSSPVTLESDKTFIVFTDAHKEFGYNDSRPFINTVKGAKNEGSKKYTVSLAFSSAISASAFNINNFDTFIISKAADKSKRTEVHLAGYPATGEGDTSQYGKGNDNSNTSGNYYLSKENLAWAIVVPADFKWPVEHKKATDAYSNLESWITSGGKENIDWYNHSTSGSVYE